MSTEKRATTTPEEHRLALTGFLDDRTLDEEAREAIRWALDRTREPDPAECEVNPRTYRLVLSAMATEPAFPSLWKAAARWALHMTEEPAPPLGGWHPDLLPKPEDCIEVIERVLALTHAPADWNHDLLREMPPPGFVQVALEWTLPILRRFVGQRGQSGEEPLAPTAESSFLASLQAMTTNMHIWPHHRRAVAWALRQLAEAPKIDASALTALAKREIRFWEEVAEVSGKVTGKAAMRAIRGFKGVLRHIGALPNS